MVEYLKAKHFLLPLAGVVLLSAMGAGIKSVHHPIKHTGPCTFSYQFKGKCYWFMRPNNEFFEMCFDNPPPLSLGLKLSDITYTDDNADYRHFIKAQQETK